jgi:S1-C subfamily serine protease
VFTKKAVTKLAAAAMLLMLALVAVLSAAAQDGAAPYLGVTIAENEAGAEVLAVAPGSPAEAAGLQAGDIITMVGDTDVTAASLAEAVRGQAVGDTITLSVLRGGETLSVEATLAERPAEATAEPQQITPPVVVTGAYLGVTLEQTEAGVMLAEVAADSPAAQAGLEAGDIVTAINGSEVASVTDVSATVRAAQPGDTLALTVERDGEALEIEATLGETVLDMMGMGPMRGMNISGDVALFINDGWHVVELDENGALYAAGLRVGDIVTAVDGESRTPDTLSEYLNGLDSSADVALTVTRSGEDMEVSVPVRALTALNMVDMPFGQMPFGQGQQGIPDDMPMMTGARLGVSFQTLDAEVAAQNNLDVTEGALVMDVSADSPAEQAGLLAGDVITAVDGDAVDARRTLAERISAYDPGDTVVLTVLRAGDTIEVEVVLGESEGGFNMPFFGGRGDGTGRFFHMIPRGGQGFRFELPPMPQMPAATPEAGANL